MLLKPGKYRFAELAEICGTSRTTAEKFPTRYGIAETTVLYNGREVSGVDLKHEDIDTISKDYPRVLTGDLTAFQLPIETPVKEESKGNDALVEELRNRINAQKDEISQLKEDKQETESKLSEARDTISELRTTIATLEADARVYLKDAESNAKLIEQYEARIAELKEQVASERSRADAFNNQIAGQANIVQQSKSADAYFKELKEQLDNLKSKTIIQVEETEAPKPKGIGQKIAAAVAVLTGR